MTTLGFASNGPLTSFTLTGCSCGRHWFLCRDDIKRISEGIFTLDDGRPEIELLDGEQPVIIEKAKMTLLNLSRGVRLADLGEGYFDHFERNVGKFEKLSLEDLGRKIIWEGVPYVLLGAKPRARTRPLVVKNLLNGSVWRFSESAVEEALNKALREETITTSES